MSDNMKDVYGKAKDNYSFKIKLKSGILVVWFIILTIICLLPIYILVINATRSHTDIANGLSFIPSNYLKNNWDFSLKIRKHIQSQRKTDGSRLNKKICIFFPFVR